MTSQGCADAGLCYPPMQSGGERQPGRLRRQRHRAARSPTPAPGRARRLAPGDDDAPRRRTAAGDELGAIEAVLRGGTFWSVVGAFFLAGLLLSLTPCVLPMLPIVSSIIVGQAGTAPPSPACPRAPAAGAARREPADVAPPRLRLAASYSLGMAVVYTAFGVAAGLAGEGLAAALQNPWVLGAFALGLVALSLSMFGVYELQLPPALACSFALGRAALPAGRVAGVFAMGGVSALIVSPCVAAPLAGALLYLSQTRDVWLGGTALFSLAAGMSVPLLLVGASAGACCRAPAPGWTRSRRCSACCCSASRSGPCSRCCRARWRWRSGARWRSARRRCWSRTAGRGGTARAGAVGRLPRRAWRHALGALLGLVGVLQIVGAASGGTDPLQPLAHLSSRSELAGAADVPRFTRGAQRRRARRRAALGRPAGDARLLCRLVRLLQGDGALHLHRSGGAARLAGALLLKADVTANNAEDRELLRRFRLFGPPGTIFFDAAGPRDRRRARRSASRNRALPRDAAGRRALSGRGRGLLCAILPGSVARWSSLVARWAHNPKVAGSNPALATTNSRRSRIETPTSGLAFCFVDLPLRAMDSRLLGLQSSPAASRRPGGER